LTTLCVLNSCESRDTAAQDSFERITRPSATIFKPHRSFSFAGQEMISSTRFPTGNWEVVSKMAPLLLMLIVLPD
jgi:hypothetical protein